MTIAASPEPDAPFPPWRARDALLATLAGLGASVLGAIVVRRGGLSTIDLFAVVLPLQSAGTLACAFFMARRRGPLRRVLALTARWSDLTGIAVGAGIQIVGASVALSIIETLFEGEVPGQEIVIAAAETVGWSTQALVVIGLVIIGPIAEEVVFRGMLLPSLLGRGRRWAVMVSSALFAALHLMDPSAAFSVPFLFVLALVLGYERLRTGRLGRPVAIHAGFNLITVIAVFAA